jgi:hypothetical protein
VQERVFYEVTPLMKFFVLFPLYGTVSLGRDDRIHALVSGLIENGVAIIPAIRKQMFGGNAFDQAASLRAIRCGTRRNNDSDRHTRRIHGQR